MCGFQHICGASLRLLLLDMEAVALFLPCRTLRCSLGARQAWCQPNYSGGNSRSTGGRKGAADIWKVRACWSAVRLCLVNTLGVGGAEARSAVFPRTGHAPLVEAQLDFFSPSGLSQSTWPSWHPSQCVASGLSALCKCSPAYTWFAPVSFLGEVFASFPLQNDRENRVIPSSVLGTDLLNLLSMHPQ